MRHLLAPVALLALAPAVRAQDVVESQLDALVERMADRGFDESHLRQRGSLREGQTRTYTIRFDAPGRYVLAGVCDEDCSDVDLFMYDGRGRLLARDNAVDDAPVLNVNAPRAGTYRVRVRMYACSIEPCGFGVVVFGQ